MYTPVTAVWWQASSFCLKGGMFLSSLYPESVFQTMGPSFPLFSFSRLHNSIVKPSFYFIINLVK